VKKITIAALIIGAFATSAQAQSNVTMYGLVDLGVAKSSGKTTEMRENKASRLGFKGTEDLGNGLKAIFKLEGEFKADTGEMAADNTLFDREANVGLQGAFGTAIVGRTKNLIDGTQSSVDPFSSYGVVGKNIEKMMRGDVGSSRVSNSITYTSPSMSGFSVGAQADLSEKSGTDAGYRLLGGYKNGPIFAHVGYERANQLALDAAALAADAKPSLWVVGGGYTFGPAQVTASYTNGDTDVAATGEKKSFLVGLSYNVGQGDIRAVYGKQKQTAVNIDKDTIKEFGLGYDYNLSKRTGLYAYAGRESVASVTSYQVGVTHKF
jgi:predicted porin